MKFIINELGSSFSVKFQFMGFIIIRKSEEMTSHKWTQIFTKWRYLLLFRCIHGRGFARNPRIVIFSYKLIIAQLITKLCILCRSQCFPCYKKVHTFKPYFLTIGISPVLPSTARSIRWFLIPIYFSDKTFSYAFLKFFLCALWLVHFLFLGFITRIICGTKYVFPSY